MSSTKMVTKHCQHCGKKLPEGSRKDKMTCSSSCRVAKHILTKAFNSKALKSTSS